MGVKRSWQRPDDGNYGKGFDGIDWSAKGQKPRERECKCSLRTKLVGDGCDVCNPELAERYRQEAEQDDQEDEE